MLALGNKMGLSARGTARPPLFAVWIVQAGFDTVGLFRPALITAPVIRGGTPLVRRWGRAIIPRLDALVPPNARSLTVTQVSVSRATSDASFFSCVIVYVHTRAFVPPPPPRQVGVAMGRTAVEVGLELSPHGGGGLGGIASTGSLPVTLRTFGARDIACVADGEAALLQREASLATTRLYVLVAGVSLICVFMLWSANRVDG